MDIKFLRQEIDTVNIEILHLFEKRMELSRDIANYKKENGLPVYDEKREAEIIAYISSIANQETKDYSIKMFKAIMDISKEYQSDLI